MIMLCYNDKKEESIEKLKIVVKVGRGREVFEMGGKGSYNTLLFTLFGFLKYIERDYPDKDILKDLKEYNKKRKLEKEER